MKVLRGMWRDALRALGWSALGLLVGVQAQAACSTWQGKAFLNEYYFGSGAGSPPNFLELYSADRTYQTAWSGFSVDVYNALNTAQHYTFDDNTASMCTQGNKSWVVYNVSGGLVASNALVVLRDATGAPVDALVFDNGAPPAPWPSAASASYYPALATECPALASALTTQAGASTKPSRQTNMLVYANSGNKNFARFPDGSGVWDVSANQGASTTYSQCSSNNSVLRKTADVATATPGTVVTFTITVTNSGNKDMTGVSVRDDVPAGLTSISAVTTSGTASISGQTVTWTAGTIAAGATVTLTIRATIPSTAVVGTTYTNTATTTAGVTPSQTDSATVTVVSAGPNHLRILHDGQGLTCAAKSITLRACADVNCTTLYTGNVTASLTSPASGWSPNPVTITNGSATVNLSAASASVVTLGATATSLAAANTTRCFNGITETCQMSFSACANSFTCLESGTLTAAGSNLSTGRLYTKLAGSAFGFDVAALKSDGTVETGYVTAGGTARTVTVELVDGSSGGACASLPALNPAVSQALTFQSADGGRKAIAPVTVNRAYRNVQCRVTDATVSPSKVSCSTDKFAIRPQAFSSVTSSVATADTANGSSTTATPRLKAVSAPFDLTATAIAGYDGTPKIDNSLAEAHVGSVATGAVTGSFGAAASTTGQASGNGFTYSEVGYVRFKPNGVYDDGFASVDSEAGDCTSDFSNALASGKYGCKFGNTANTAWFGRFIPDHFTLASASLTPACGSGFSYMSQPFALAYTIRAENGGATPAVTQNYVGGFARGTVSRVAENNNDGTDRSLRLSASIAEPAWTAGMQTFNDSGFRFMRTTTADGPYSSLVLGVKVSDPDGPVLTGLNMRATTSDDCIAAVACDAKSLNGASPTIMRYGRMTAARVHQHLETQPLTLPLTAEYFDGTTFRTNGLDSCTALGSASMVRLDNNQQSNRTTGSISMGAGSTTLSGLGSFSSGVLNLGFSAPGAGNGGFVDVTPLLGAAEAGNRPWLQYDWDGNGSFTDNPRGRASWGMYRGNPNVIYMREVWR